MLTTAKSNSGPGAMLLVAVGLCTVSSYLTRPEPQTVAPVMASLRAEPAPEPLSWLTRPSFGEVSIADAPAVSTDGSILAYTTDLGKPQWPLTALYWVDTRSQASKRCESPSDQSWGPSQPALTPDGRYVVFTSPSDQLDTVTADTNRAQDVFRLDTRTHTTVRVSLKDGSLTQGGRRLDSGEPSVSEDGNLVALESKATLDAEENGGCVKAIYVRDIARRTTRRVSLSTAGVLADADCERPQLARNGRFVIFESQATNLVRPAETKGNRQIYVRDLNRGSTECLSVSPQGRPGDGFSSQACITSDGQTVAFASSAANLVPGSGKGKRIFVRDLRDGQTRLASGGAVDLIRRMGTGDAASCQRPYLCSGGRYLMFTAQPYDSRTGRVDSKAFVFMLDRRTQRLVQVAEEAAGVALSGDGRWCILATHRPLHPSDKNGRPDLYRMPNPLASAPITEN